MLSQTVEYALRAMMHLSAAASSRTSVDIARHTRVPKQYLSKVLRDLAVARLVTSRRGPHGGFRLARPPAEISMLDVIDAVDPIRRIDRCPLGNPAHLNLCPLHRRLDHAIEMIRRTYATTSLGEILESGSGHGECTSLLSVSTSAGR